MLNGKRILVLLSTYQGEQYIKEQVDSILQQSIAENLHIRIRDDGSTDGTRAKLASLAEAHPGMIEVSYGSHQGWNASFLQLLHEADGYDYYALADQDDVWLPDKLECAVKKLAVADDSLPLLYASPSYLVKSNLAVYGSTRKRQRPIMVMNALIQNICAGHTQVLNGKLLTLLKAQRLDASHLYAYDWWIAALAALYGQILFDNGLHDLYRQHGRNLLGAGGGRLGRLFMCAKRARGRQSRAFREQVRYFAEVNERGLREEGSYGELERYLQADAFRSRVDFMLHSRLYRQSLLETVAFRLGVLLGYL